MFRMAGLIRAGYPIAANALTVDEWEDLARLSAARDDTATKIPKPVYWVTMK